MSQQPGFDPNAYFKQQQQPQSWGGFNAGNVFSSWDLNPLSQQTGMSRDQLSLQRDQFLQPYYNQYRGAVKADQGDQELFGSSDFQGFVQTGALPKNATPAQQWNAQGGPTAGTGDALIQQLMLRAQQGLNVNRNDPTVRAQVDPFAANVERSRRNYVSDVAERSGPYANIRGEERMAAERAGQQTGAFEAEIIGREVAARRDEIQQALLLWGNQLTNDQRMALERELAQLQDRARTADRSQANDQFLRELALREYGLTNELDLRWAGL